MNLVSSQVYFDLVYVGVINPCLNKLGMSQLSKLLLARSAMQSATSSPPYFKCSDLSQIISANFPFLQSFKIFVTKSEVTFGILSKFSLCNLIKCLFNST